MPKRCGCNSRYAAFLGREIVGSKNLTDVSDLRAAVVVSLYATQAWFGDLADFPEGYGKIVWNLGGLYRCTTGAIA